MKRTKTRRGWYKPVGPPLNKLLDAYHGFLQDVGKQFEQKAHQLAEQRGDAISCKRGCTFCCRQTVAVSLAEALVIARHLFVFRKGEMSDLIDKLGDQAKRQEQLGRAKWFALQEDCAFVNAQNDCSVYRVRPAACSTYMVVSPPEQCSEVGGGADVVNPDPIMKLLMEKSAEFMRQCVGQPIMAYGVLGNMVLVAINVLLDDSFDCLEKYGIDVNNPGEFERILDGE